MPGMGSAIGRTGSPEDIGNLDGGARGSGVVRFLRRNEDAQTVKRTGHGPHRARCHLGVEGSVLQLGVTEQRLDNADIDAVFQKMGGKAVPQCVWADAPGNLGRMRRLDHDAIELSGADRLERVLARKQPAVAVQPPWRWPTCHH